MVAINSLVMLFYKKYLFCKIKNTRSQCSQLLSFVAAFYNTSKILFQTCDIKIQIRLGLYTNIKFSS